MTDLSHDYDSDVTYQETQVKIADTEFAAQKLGQDTNYLLDAYQPISDELDILNASVALVANVNTSWGGADGTNALFTTPNGADMVGAILFVPQMVSGPPTQDNRGAVPFITVGGGAAENLVWNTASGFFRFFISGNTCYVNTNHSGGFSVNGIQIYKPV